MNIQESIKSRPAAKTLSDVDIPEASWKPDFDIVDRYQCFANELMRVALLGIAGYGYLIKEVCMTDPKFYHMLIGLTNYLWLGSLSLSFSLILALAHKFFSTACLYYQILIMRSLKRLGNSHWNLEEKTAEGVFVKNIRDLQRKKSRVSHVILFLSAIFFAIGFLCVIALFYLFLHQLPNELTSSAKVH